MLDQVLTPDAVAGAVRAHGLGLLPAAVNAVYKFLATRIASLSQVGVGLQLPSLPLELPVVLLGMFKFRGIVLGRSADYFGTQTSSRHRIPLAPLQVLFQEGVAGRLQVEGRWWGREGRGSLPRLDARSAMYPVERASRLAADLALPPDSGGGGEQQGGDAGSGGGALSDSASQQGGDGPPPHPLQQLRLLVTGAVVCAQRCCVIRQMLQRCGSLLRQSLSRLCRLGCFNKHAVRCISS